MTDSSTHPSHADLERAEGHASFSDAVIRDMQDLLGIDHDTDPVAELRERLLAPTPARTVPDRELDRLDVFARQFGSVAMSGRTARALIAEVRAARAAITDPEAFEYGVLSFVTGKVESPMTREDAERSTDTSAIYGIVVRPRTPPWMAIAERPDGLPGPPELTPTPRPWAALDPGA